VKIIHWNGESLTVGELRSALEGIPDDAEVVIQTTDDAEDVVALSSRDRGVDQLVTFYITPREEEPGP
jgi:hypothetical protein